jgi:hypothetical protein
MPNTKVVETRYDLIFHPDKEKSWMQQPYTYSSASTPRNLEKDIDYLLRNWHKYYWFTHLEVRKIEVKPLFVVNGQTGKRHETKSSC